MTDINLETVTEALSEATCRVWDDFEHDSTYFGDAKNGRLVVTWLDEEDRNTSVTFTVTVSDLEIEHGYGDDE